MMIVRELTAALQNQELGIEMAHESQQRATEM